MGCSYSTKFLDLSTRWKLSESSLSLSIPHGIFSWYPPHRMLCGLQKRSEGCGVENNILPIPGIEPRPSNPYPVAIPTEISDLLQVRIFYRVTKYLCGNIYIFTSVSFTLHSIVYISNNKQCFTE
jgi:hypothetical protein